MRTKIGTAQEALIGRTKWNAENDIGAACQVIDWVMSLFWNQKERAILALFGDAHEVYLNEWRKRSPDVFWGHLDLGNRARLVKLAIEFYGPGGTYADKGTPNKWVEGESDGAL